MRLSRLASLAPELLVACEDAVNSSDGSFMHVVTGDILDRMRNLIAKAKGGA